MVRAPLIAAAPSLYGDRHWWPTERAVYRAPGIIAPESQSYPPSR